MPSRGGSPAHRCGHHRGAAAPSGTDCGKSSAPTIAGVASPADAHFTASRKNARVPSGLAAIGAAGSRFAASAFTSPGGFASVAVVPSTSPSSVFSTGSSSSSLSPSRISSSASSMRRSISASKPPGFFSSDELLGDDASSAFFAPSRASAGGADDEPACCLGMPTQLCFPRDTRGVAPGGTTRS